jgi:hypothetical protein
MIRLIMCNFFDGDDFHVMGENHHVKYRRGYLLHRINVAMYEQDIVFKWGVYNFNFDENGFPPKFYGEILEEPFKG